MWAIVDIERVTQVAISWTLVLIGLLIAREILRARRRPSWATAMRVMDLLVIAMVLSVGGVTLLYYATLAARDRTPPVAGAPTQTPSEPTGTPSTDPSPVATTTTSPGLTPSASPTTGGSPTPSASQTPPPSPSASASEPAGGVVTAGPALRTYEVRRGRVTGFTDTLVPDGIRAECTVPASYVFPSLGDPDATIELVMITNGRFAGTYLSLNDEGVTFTPS